MTNKAKPTVPDPNPPALSDLGRGKTVLLVEDHKLMQAVTERLLKRFGFHVLTAGSVADGLALWEAHADSVHLVLTDHNFSGRLTGMDLIHTLHTHRPTLPALMISASWHPKEMGDDSLPPHVYFLGKPFRPPELAQALRLLLEGFTGKV